MDDKCPFCQKPIQPDFQACPYCGNTLINVCPSCMKPVEPEWNTCPICGTSLSNNQNIYKTNENIELPVEDHKKNKKMAVQNLVATAKSMPPLYLVCFLALATTLIVFAGFCVIKLTAGIQNYRMNQAQTSVYSDLKSRYSFRIFRPTYIPDGFEYVGAEDLGGGREGVNITYKEKKSTAIISIIEPPQGGDDGQASVDLGKETLENGQTVGIRVFSNGGGAAWAEQNGEPVFELYFPKLPTDEMKKIAQSMIEVKGGGAKAGSGRDTSTLPKALLGHWEKTGGYYKNSNTQYPPIKTKTEIFFSNSQYLMTYADTKLDSESSDYSIKNTFKNDRRIDIALSNGGQHTIVFSPGFKIMELWWGGPVSYGRIGEVLTFKYIDNSVSP